ncbi:MAG: Wzy polymerase domain-containing protein [Betaproteobacteria bacterium]|nr:Wzy polymerase domain-containing protein [Betaproteobacteria bacterium]MDH3436791.1 Wzy polymerase domain-containing protein [Betaproteobacteria bacterium]
MLSPARASLYCCGLMFALPFLQPYHRFPLTSFYSEWLAFALGLLAALLLLLLRRQSGQDAAFPAVAFAPLGLILVLGLQTALGRVPYAEQALIAALYLLWASLLLVLGRELGRELGLTAVADALAWFVLAGGLLSALAGLVQHYEISTPVDFLIARKGSAAVYGNLGQPNHYAAQLALALASVTYLYGRRQLGGLVAGGCIAVLLFMSALAGSRSPWLYFAAFTLLALLVRRFRGDDESRKLAFLAIWLLPGFLIAQGAATLFVPAHGLWVTSAQRVFEVASGIEARIQLWGDAWRMFLDAPILGSGWGQFSWHHFVNPALTGASAAPGVFNHAHNLALHLLAETGMIGALVIIGAAVIWLLDLRKETIDSRWWWLLSLLAVIGIHSMLEFPLWYAYFLGPAALLVGLGAQRTVRVRFHGTQRLIVALCILAGLLNLFGVLAPYRDFERLLFTPERRAPSQSDDRPLGPAIAHVHREPLLTPYAELAIAYGVPVSRERLHEKLDLTARTMRFAPVAVVVYRHGLLLALAGDSAAALQQLQRSIEVYPAELTDVIAQLESLARSHPAEFTALLKLAAAKRAELRARAANR